MFFALHVYTIKYIIFNSSPYLENRHIVRSLAHYAFTKNARLTFKGEANFL